jgi:UDP-glucose 4-epimerase
MQKREHIGGNIYNVGTGENYSVNEIAQMISPKIVYTPQRAGEAKTTLANISKIHRDLGFSPKIDLKEWLQSR